MGFRADIHMFTDSVEKTVSMTITCSLEALHEVLGDLGTKEFRTQVLDALAVHKVGRELGITASHRDFTISEQHRQRGNN